MTNRSEAEAAEARARTGFIIITLVRFSGIALIMLGFAIVRGVIDLPRFVGGIIVVIGFFEFFFLPRFVARRWNAGAQRKR
ncbi:MAG: hypothetical protein ACKO1N_07275 [Erythrobacter sp.]